MNGGGWSHTCKAVCVCTLPARACGSCCISCSVTVPACLGTCSNSSPHSSSPPVSDVLPWELCLWVTHCSCADAVDTICCHDFAAKLFELGLVLCCALPAAMESCQLLGCWAGLLVGWGLQTDGDGGHFSCAAAAVSKSPVRWDLTLGFSALLLLPSCTSALWDLMVVPLADAETASGVSPGTAGRSRADCVPTLYAAALPLLTASTSGCCTFERSIGCNLVSFQ